MGFFIGIFGMGIIIFIAGGFKEYITNEVPKPVDIKQYVYYPQDFRNAYNFASQYKNLDGVNEVLSDFDNKFEEYRMETVTLVNNCENSLNIAYKKMEESYKQKNTYKWVPLILFVLNTMSLNFLSKMKGLMELGFIVSVIFVIALIIIVRRQEKKYELCFSDVRNKANFLYNKYSYIIEDVKEQADIIYLSSLDPVLRETVLMRREQEQFHKEQLESQKRHQQRVEESQKQQAIAQQEQAEFLKRQERKQEEARYDQKEQLQIERDREDRYYKNRR